MPEISWASFTKRIAKGHLVAGTVPLPGEEPDRAPGTKVRLTILARVARSLRFPGLYALVDIRSEYLNGEGDRIDCVFERREDADKLGAVVGARAIVGDLQEWASERVFRFDAALAASLEQMLKRRTIGSRAGKRRAGVLLP